MEIATKPRTEPITGEALLEMPDIGPCELVEGRIEPMSYTNREHARIVLLLGYELESFVREHEIDGKVMAGDVGVYTRRDPDTVRGADVVFASNERLAENTSENLLDVAPELVVEVISPSNSWEGVRRKIDEYFSIGAGRVWIVEPENRAVLVFSAPDAMHTLETGDTLAGDGRLDGFALPVAALFEA